VPDTKKLFETLVREHADMLTIYLTSALGDVPDVDDLFQETMVVAWRRLDDFDHTRPFGAWLRGIARNLLLAHRREQSRRRCTPVILDQLEARLGQLAGRPRCLVDDGKNDPDFSFCVRGACFPAFRRTTHFDCQCK